MPFYLYFEWFMLPFCFWAGDVNLAVQLYIVWTFVLYFIWYYDISLTKK